MTFNKNLHIAGFKVHNFQKISELESNNLTSTDAITIAGNNAQGKSSIENAIMFALAGIATKNGSTKSTISKDVEIIKHGESEAIVKVICSNGLVISRKIKKDSKTATELTLKMLEDGVERDLTFAEMNNQNEKAYLDSLLSDVGVDASIISNTDNADEFLSNKLMLALGLNEKCKVIDGEIDYYEAKRSEASKKKVEAQKRKSGISIKQEALGEKIDVQALIIREKQIDRVIQIQQETSEYFRQIEVLNEQIDQIREKQKILNNEAKNLEVSANIVSKTDVAVLNIKEEIATQLANAQSHNETIHQEEMNRKLVKQYQEEEDKADVEETEAKTFKIDAQNKRKQMSIDACSQIQGLSYELENENESGKRADTYVFRYNGQRFQSLSTAESIKLMFALVNFTNPTLKVLFCKNANMLDKKNLDLLIFEARQNEFQLWLELVAEREDCDKFTIYVENGEQVLSDATECEIAKTHETLL